MGNGRFGSLVQHFRQLIGVRPSADETDGQLLDRFVRQQDGEAFAGLVQRHGPMVLGACRRVLHDVHAAEDAFQAVFLVLARKAASIRQQQSVASWLCRAARRLALTARLRAARRQARECEATPMTPVESTPDLDRREVWSVLDEEVERLPARLHAPVVLCYLEGKTYEEAARHLQWPLGTVKKRLGQARERLRSRLTRRGMALSVAALGTTLAEKSSPAVSAGLMDRTVAAALHIAAGHAVATAAVSAQSASLAEGMMQTMFVLKMNLVAALVVTVAAVGMGGVVALQEGPLQEPAAPVFAAQPVLPEKKEQLRADALPRGAIMRLGTKRFRHDSPVASLAYSPDGKLLAAASWRDKDVRLWDSATGTEIRRLVHPDGASVVAFSPNGKWLASAGFSATIVWEAATGREVARLKGHFSNIRCIAICHDNQTLATAGGSDWFALGSVAIHKDCDQSIRVWNVATGKELQHLGTKSTNVHALAFSPGGKTLASGHYDGVHLWEVATGKERSHLAQGCANVEALAFSPDGLTLGVGTGSFLAKRKDAIFLWNLATGQARQIKQRSASVAFHPNGKTVAAAADGIRLWDVKSAREVAVLGGHLSGVSQVAFAPDGKTLAAAHGNAILLWDIATGKERQQLPGHHAEVTGLTLSRHGKLLASADSDGCVCLWDPATGKELAQMRDLPSLTTAPAISPDGRTVVGTARDGAGAALVWWQLPTGKKIRSEAVNANGIREMIFSPDSKLLVTRGHDSLPTHDYTLWDAATGKKLPTPSGAGNSFLDFSPDSKLLTVRAEHSQTVNSALHLHVTEVSTDKEVRRIDVATDKEPRRPKDSQGFHVLSLSPDKKTLAAVYGDLHFIHLFDLTTGKELHRLREPSGSAFSLVFSPDGKTLAGTGREQKTIRLWDVPSGKERCVMTGHEAWIWRITFTPDGRSLVSLSEDQTLRVWETATGKERARFQPNQGHAHTMGLSAAGRTAITGGQDGTLLIWDLRARGR
jgi:RNA polymerase sigma factor (sigma-70 family)